MRELLEKKLAKLQAEHESVILTSHLEEIETKVAEYRQSLIDADARERAEKAHTLEIKMAVVEEMLAEAALEEATAEEPTAEETTGGGYVDSTEANEVNL